MNILYNIAYALNVAVETIKERSAMFFTMKQMPFPLTILYCLYLYIFVVPFYLMLFCECFLLANMFVLFKFLGSFPIIGIFFGAIGSFLFICYSYLFYFLNIVTTALPNYLCSDESPRPFSVIALSDF